MHVANLKAHDDEVSPTKKLMKELTNYKEDISEGTALLINGKELLTQKGIKGRISQVGVGFGTGRHTSGRRSILPEIIEKITPVKRPAPVIKHTAKSVIHRIREEPPEVQSVRLPEIKKPDMVNTGCDPITPSYGEVALSARSPSRGHEMACSARTPSPPPEYASVGLTARINS